MTEAADDLEKLLLDVRKNIKDNENFLLGLMADTADAASDDDDEAGVSTGEEFEEL